MAHIQEGVVRLKTDYWQTYLALVDAWECTDEETSALLHVDSKSGVPFFDKHLNVMTV